MLSIVIDFIPQGAVAPPFVRQPSLHYHTATRSSSATDMPSAAAVLNPGEVRAGPVGKLVRVDRAHAQIV